MIWRERLGLATTTWRVREKARVACCGEDGAQHKRSPQKKTRKQANPLSANHLVHGAPEASKNQCRRCSGTAGLQISYTHTKYINLPMNQKSYNNSKTTVGKLSTRRVQICRIYFCAIHFCSSAKISGPSEMPRFVGKLFFS